MSFILIVLVITASFTTLDSYGQVTRDQISDIRKQIKEANTKYGQADTMIVTLRQEIIETENELKILTVQLKKTESELGKSWDAIQNIDTYKSKVRVAEEKLNDQKNTLLNLQKEKETWFNQRNSLQSELDTTNQQWIDENKPDLTGMTKLIGVKLSQSCTTMIKNNITNNCPTYEELAQLDTSNTRFSGEFGYEDGWYHRLDSPFKNGFESYKYDPTIRIIVDPPSNHQSRIKMITIENNFGTFIEAPEDNKVYDNTVTVHERRDVKGCRTAQISTDGWEELLPDTLYYLRNGCTSTNFDNKVVTVRDDTYWNPLDSAGWHYRNWLESVKLLCIGLC